MHQKRIDRNVISCMLHVISRTFISYLTDIVRHILQLYFLSMKYLLHTCQPYYNFGTFDTQFRYFLYFWLHSKKIHTNITHDSFACIALGECIYSDMCIYISIRFNMHTLEKRKKVVHFCVLDFSFMLSSYQFIFVCISSTCLCFWVFLFCLSSAQIKWHP